MNIGNFISTIIISYMQKFKKLESVLKNKKVSCYKRFEDSILKFKIKVKMTNYSTKFKKPSLLKPKNSSNYFTLYFNYLIHLN